MFHPVNESTSVEITFANDRDLKHLILLRSKLAISCLLRKCFGLRRYCRQPLVAGVLDDRCNETVVSGDSNRNIRFVIPNRFFQLAWMRTRYLALTVE